MHMYIYIYMYLYYIRTTTLQIATTPGAAGSKPRGGIN